MVTFLFLTLVMSCRDKKEMQTTLALQHSQPFMHGLWHCEALNDS